MTDREKLLNLLMDELPDPSPWDGEISLLLERLLANGVVVREWIPVTKRLPEPFVSVLVQMPYEAPYPTVREGFISADGIWCGGLYHREPDEITHWMPLPEPPMRKGENG